MVFYSRHTDEACFYYRVSKKAGDITTLGAELKIETTYNTTYPSPFILSADTKHFYICWRGIKWHPTIARYTLPGIQDDVNLDWGPYQMIQSTAARPYCKYYSNGKDSCQHGVAFLSTSWAVYSQTAWLGGPCDRPSRFGAGCKGQLWRIGIWAACQPWTFVPRCCQSIINYMKERSDFLFFFESTKNNVNFILTEKSRAIYFNVFLIQCCIAIYD